MRVIHHNGAMREPHGRIQGDPAHHVSFSIRRGADAPAGGGVR